MAKQKSSRVSYYLLIEPVWKSLNGNWDKGCEEFLRQFRLVQPELANLFAAQSCQSEVRNGGLAPYFESTKGLLAPEALEAFKAIGMTKWAEVLAEALKVFPSPYPRERADRVAILEKLPRSGDKIETFVELDKRFLQGADFWQDAANAYAAKIK